MPADEQSLMRFASLLADNLHHSSIKVYLSAVRSLHIDNGLPDQLSTAAAFIKGIRRVQGSSPSSRLPITVDLLQIIQRSLDLKVYDHVMLWAACCLGFFGFLRAGEFTTNSAFDPSIQPAVSDIQADALVDLLVFKFTLSPLRWTHFALAVSSTLAVVTVVFAQWRPLVTFWLCGARLKGHCFASRTVAP